MICFFRISMLLPFLLSVLLPMLFPMLALFPFLIIFRIIRRLLVLHNDRDTPILCGVRISLIHQPLISKTTNLLHLPFS